MKKKIALLMAMVMLFGMTVAGTLAWLQAGTGPVVNTFTVGDINITLDETNVEGTGRDTTNEYKMVPGQKYVKDPIVHVQPGSEPCWVFVKVAEENNNDDVIQYAVDTTSWALVDKDENIYVYGTATVPTAIDALTATVPVDTTSVFAVTATGETTNITISSEVTKADMENWDGVDADGNAASAEITARPKLTITAFAIQSANITVSEAIEAAVNTL